MKAVSELQKTVKSFEKLIKVSPEAEQAIKEKESTKQQA